MSRAWFKGLRIKVAAAGAVALLGAGTFKYSAFAEGEADENPYLQLYRLRVSQAEANLRRKEAVQVLAGKNLERGRKLIASHAMSQEEFDTLFSEETVARTEVDLASQKVEESKAYYKIISSLVARGVSIPLCTYEME